MQVSINTRHLIVQNSDLKELKVIFSYSQK